MRAAWIDALGPPDSIRYGDLPIPTFGPSDVLIRVFATAVNPVDTFIRSGRYRTPLHFPFVIGRDLVGQVCERGVGVVRTRIGDWVWCNSLGYDGRQGACADYAVAPEERIYPLPQGVDPLVAVAAAHPAATAYLALITHGRLTAGECVFIGGGAGNVGAAAIAIAAQAGARIIATAAAGDLDYCRSLGAHIALDYRARDLDAVLRAEAAQGIQLHLDTSGHIDFEVAIEHLALRGRMILMAGLANIVSFPVGKFYVRDGQLLGFVISNATTAELSSAAARINALLSEGLLYPRRIETLPLSAATDAHRRLEAGHARGTRLVLRADMTVQ